MLLWHHDQLQIFRGNYGRPKSHRTYNPFALYYSFWVSGYNTFLLWYWIRACLILRVENRWSEYCSFIKVSITWIQGQWNINRPVHKYQLQWYWTVQGVNPNRGKGFFLFSTTSRSVMDSTHSLILCVLWFFPGGKEAGADSQLVTRASAEVKNEWSYSRCMPSWREQGKLHFFQWYEVITLRVSMQCV